VIVVDDCSPDDTKAVLAELAKTTSLNLRVARNDRNRGPGPARNVGWRLSDAPVIAFTDDDCMPTPGWLEAGLDALERTSAGVVQGRTLPDPKTALGRWAVTQRIEEFSDLYETCNIFYRTEVLRMTGGFDEDVPFFGEDTVLGWTARRRGVQSSFAPDALVHHAVIHPGVSHYRRWAAQHGNWAILVRRFPEMRREVLWMGLFTKRRHAALVGAAVGIAAGTVWRPAFALAIPYAMVLRPRSLHRDEIVDRLLGGIFDAAVVTGLLSGSIRERTLVL
jgi:glycosyltransferase involved in cell wall biosynthesis